MTHPPTTPGPDEPVPPPPSGYDPAQSYVVYQAAPTFGYGIPTAGQQQAGFDPMISPDYAGWWQRSLAIFKGAWKQLGLLQLLGFVLTLAVVVPEAIWSLSAATDFVDSLDAAGSSGATPSLTPLIAPFALLFLGAVLAALVAGNQIAVTVASGHPPRLGPALALAVRRFVPLWGWQLLVALMILVGVCLCVLPGIYLYAVFLILPAVVTFERGTSAISRCFRLFHHDFGAAIARVATIVGLTLLVGIVSYVVGQIVQVAMDASAGGALDTDSGSGAALTSSAIAAVVVSRVISTLLESGMKMLTDVLTVTAYADLRARLEPLSTAQLAAEAGVRPAGPPSEWVAPPL
jgi:hypothetical protein